EPPADSGYRYLANYEFIEYRRFNDPAPDGWDGRWHGLEVGRPAAMYFFYRSARRPLAPTNYHFRRETSGRIDPLNPPPIEPGMAGVDLDLRSRLLRYYKVADYVGRASAPPRPAAAAGRPGFVAAGLEYGAFAARPVSPRLQPPVASDARFAWVGPYPDPAVDRVRVEAASLGGKPVYFAIV